MVTGHSVYDAILFIAIVTCFGASGPFC